MDFRQNPIPMAMQEVAKQAPPAQPAQAQPEQEGQLIALMKNMTKLLEKQNNIADNWHRQE